MAKPHPGISDKYSVHIPAWKASSPASPTKQKSPQHLTYQAIQPHLQDPCPLRQPLHSLKSISYDHMETLAIFFLLNSSYSRTAPHMDRYLPIFSRLNILFFHPHLHKLHLDHSSALLWKSFGLLLPQELDLPWVVQPHRGDDPPLPCSGCFY